MERSDSCMCGAGGVTAATWSGQRGGEPWQGRRGHAVEGLTDHGGPCGELPKSLLHPEPGATATASPMLASPSVNMMMMEVLLSGTLCSSRALFSMLMPVSSPSLMLVTGTRTQTDRWHCGRASSACRVEEDSRPCSCAQGPCPPVRGGSR